MGTPMLPRTNPDELAILSAVVGQLHKAILARAPLEQGWKLVGEAQGSQACQGLLPHR